jgi:preprotein translocase subunit SecA
MLTRLLAKIFGTKNERIIKGYGKIVQIINSFEEDYSVLPDDVLKNHTVLFRERIKKGEALDSLLPEAFATVREVAKRTLGQRPYDVQLMGGIALHQGCIAEMKTGEGKTLVATLALYLNSLAQSSHLVTVNDYLAKRDAEWMAPIYNFLGLTVSYLQNFQNDAERKAVYGADIIYGTNSEFGFDYLKDNMKFDSEQFVQKKLSYAIVDEVDSILIDEARTPLIISGPSEKDTRLYKAANDSVKWLVKGKGEEKDLEVDEKGRSAMLTEEGINKVEKFLGINNIYAPENILVLHHVQQALKAHFLFKRDVDYMVTPVGEVLIVDEFTGRALPGRRFSDGLHQAIEAKEGVEIERENQTLATITLQNYFRIYNKLAGMTGTASSDAVEFHKIYNLSVVSVPTHRPMIRKDEEDVIYLTQDAKYKAVVDDIKASHERGQPVLVGTASIEASEHLSYLLNRQGIPHNVLNAKQHAKEAEIIKAAGERGRVTISTSMAGRGTDIKLGVGVAELGGLRVIGTERYENRRIDDQLRGRSGRQGDPGSSKFYISLEDDLMRIFGGDKTKEWMQKWGGMEEDESIESSWVSSMVKSNQEKQERHHFDSRKHLLEYDDVMNQQRNVIYKYRKEILASGDTLHTLIKNMISDVVTDIFAIHEEKKSFYGASSVAEVNKATELVAHLTDLSVDELLDSSTGSFHQVKDLIIANAVRKYEEYHKAFPAEMINDAEKWTLLNIVDYAWKNHLQNLDHLKEGIGLRGYGQKNPLYEYKKESFDEFVQMVRRIKEDVIKRIFKLKPQSLDQSQIKELERVKEQELAEFFELAEEGKGAYEEMENKIGGDFEAEGEEGVAKPRTSSSKSKKTRKNRKS